MRETVLVKISEELTKGGRVGEGGSSSKLWWNRRDGILLVLVHSTKFRRNTENP